MRGYAVSLDTNQGYLEPDHLTICHNFSDPVLPRYSVEGLGPASSVVFKPNSFPRDLRWHSLLSLNSLI